MNKSKNSVFKSVLTAACASGLLVAAQAQTIVLNIDGGFISGSISGMSVSFPFKFEMKGSFADKSTVVISFDAGGSPSFAVDPLYPRASTFYAIDFGAGSAVPSFSARSRPYQRPALTVFNTPDSQPQSVSPDGWQTSLASAIPEPQALAMMLVGLPLLCGVALRRRKRQSLDCALHATGL